MWTILSVTIWTIAFKNSFMCNDISSVKLKKKLIIKFVIENKIKVKLR